jgi:UDP-N-acetylmuramoyl-L-alanyl-D-glutamate--2,6-diaminopimelate ligase
LNAVLITPTQAADWLRLRILGTLRADSRQVQAGDGFLAWPGAATDARRFVPAVLQAGAAACLMEREGAEQLGLDLHDPRLGLYEGLRAAAAPLASAFFGEPSTRLDVLAVTGTNGKTSTAWWLAQALGLLGQRCALVGTLGIGEPGAMEANGLTTPDPVLLQSELHRLADLGFVACAMEASSIGLQERRLDGTRIRCAIFTNFTQDHLDYHGDMAAYWQAKARLFDWPQLQAAVIHIDDAQGARLADALAGRSGLDCWTTSCTGRARLQAKDIRHGPHGLDFEVLEAGGAVHTVHAPVVGHYNVANVLGVIAALRTRGVPLADAARVCGQLSPVPGRMDSLGGAGLPLVVVDYAHTPDALDKVLAALRPVAQSRGGQLWCVVGCGGDRDPSKRPLMAAAAEQGADRLVLTSDNPRSEEPAHILNAMAAGLERPAQAQVLADRAQAIAQALRQADPADVVLLAGKGHEAFQESQGKRLPFSDREHALTGLQLRSPQGVAA